MTQLHAPKPPPRLCPQRSPVFFFRIPTRGSRCDLPIPPSGVSYLECTGGSRGDGRPKCNNLK